MSQLKQLTRTQRQYLYKLGYPETGEYVIRQSNSFKNPGREFVARDGSFCFFLDKPQKFIPKKTQLSDESTQTNVFTMETEEPPLKKMKIEDDRLSEVIKKLDVLEQMLYELINKN